MARGSPGLWSAVASSPFLAVGVYLISEPVFHSLLFAPFLGFGAFVLLTGFYIQLVSSPGPPSLQSDEQLLDKRRPSQRVALARTALSVPFLVTGLYLLLWTRRPYVYPTVAFLSGLWFFSTGLRRYWMNCLTTYYVTSKRLVKRYRFFSRVQQDVPFEKVRAVDERRSFFETVVGLGDIKVASGTGGLAITVRNIDTPTKFANQIRELI